MPNRHMVDNDGDMGSPKMPTRKQVGKLVGDTAVNANHKPYPSQQDVGAFKHVHTSLKDDRKPQATTNIPPPPRPSDAESKRQAIQGPPPIPLQPSHSAASNSMRSGRTRGGPELSDDDHDMVPPPRKNDTKAQYAAKENYHQQQGQQTMQQQKPEKGNLAHFDVVGASASSLIRNAPENRVGARAVDGSGGRAGLTLAPAQAPSTTRINEVPGNTDLEHGTIQQQPPSATPDEVLLAAEVVPEGEDFDARVEQIVNQRTEGMFNEFQRQLGRDLVSAKVVTATPEEPEKDDTDPEDTPPDSNRRPKKCWIIVACIVILGAIGAVVAVILGSGSGDPKDDPIISPTGPKVTQAPVTPSPTQAPVTNAPTTMAPTAPTQAPSSSPTAAPTRNPRYQFASQRLFDVSGDKIYEEGTSQFQALEWLVYQDPAELQFSQIPLRVLKERYALAVFYFSMQGKNWVQQSNFLSGSSICIWNIDDNFGVQCESEGVVSGLLFSGNNLFGSIPTELIVLTSLSTINLKENSIFGSLPPEIGNLKLLESINLNTNQLTGTIPPSLFEIPRIKTVYLSFNNNLGGKIPETVTGAGNLVELSCSTCSLDGTIPKDLSNLRNMEFFQFYGNLLSGPIPASLTALPKLETLGLSENVLTGPLPEFANQPSLESIFINNNLLNGSFPKSVGLLENLVYLYANSNTFSGSVPLFVGNKNALLEINLWGCNLAGNFAEFLFSLPKTLAYLQIAQNQLTGSIPTEIGLFSNLFLFETLSNRFTGNIPTEFGNLLDMVSLGLGDNKLEGMIPSELGYLVELTFLEMGENQLSGQIPSELGDLVELTSLGFGLNQFLNGTVPQSFSSLTVLTRLTLQGNMLSGSVDSTLCIPDLSITNLFADCLGLSPEIICTCCFACCSGSNTEPECQLNIF